MCNICLFFSPSNSNAVVFLYFHLLNFIKYGERWNLLNLSISAHSMHFTASHFSNFVVKVVHIVETFDSFPQKVDRFVSDIPWKCLKSIPPLSPPLPPITKRFNVNTKLPKRGKGEKFFEKFGIFFLNYF